MSTTAVVYEVCHSCGVGKAMPETGADSPEISEFIKDHVEHRLDLVPEAVFCSAYLKRGYTDVDRPNAQPIETSMGDNVVTGEKETPFGKPVTGADAVRQARDARRALLSAPVRAVREIDQLNPVADAAEAAQFFKEATIVPARTIQMRPLWDETFMEVARVLAKRGTCSRLQVGAVLVKDTRIISTGYNGAPAGLRHCDHRDGGDMENGHCARAEHAERNALLLARQDARLATMYVTAAPCLSCARNMVTVGITKIVYGHDYRPDPRVDELCASAGIELIAFR